ncbi:MAG: MiaB/RimO family radical SAM methylthiotransferase [Deltaproteobacteria bacterium]|jgi:MiaB/RimO family radical SAM methylthiotransferase|nr:MiaB/RimO family radical SAM methylthiotransferase [Deltaproteobacteria bacterium]
MKTYYLASAGCPRRAVDSQKIADYLETNNIKYTQDVKKADLIIVSTCAALKSREDLSKTAVTWYQEQKRRDAKVVVAGCLGKINPAVKKEFSEVAFISPREIDALDDMIAAKVPFKDIPDPNQIGSFPLFPDKPERQAKGDRLNKRLDLAYEKEDLFTLRIATGCLGNCSYCAVKFAVGQLESKPLDKIVTEFKSGLDKGFEHFVLIAGDVGCYGVDIGISAVELLRALFAVEGSYKIIIKEFNAQWVVKYFEDLLHIFKQHYEKIDYVVVPVQSASNRILRLMKRPYSIEDVKKYLNIIKAEVPGLQVSTHIMVGFPGETEADFRESIDFIKDYEFPFVDIYAYDDRPNTAASQMAGKVPQDVIDARVHAVKKVQKQILTRLN